MQKYKCHKVVEAAKILSVLDNPTTRGVLLHLAGEKQGLAMTLEWELKHKPEAGGYFVRYEDGYTSYSPAGAFEAGYTAIDDDSTPEPLAPKATERPFSDQNQTEPILQYFTYAHLPEHLRTTSGWFAALAYWVVDNLPRNAERTVALRKLLEGKDAAVRARLAK